MPPKSTCRWHEGGRGRGASVFVSPQESPPENCIGQEDLRVGRENPAGDGDLRGGREGWRPS